MAHTRRPDIEKIEDTLDQIAEWLIACYGQRIVSVSLILTILYTAREASTFDAMTDMKKVDIAAIEAARHG